MDDLVRHLEGGGDLDPGQVRAAADALLDESGDPAVKASFLAALSTKGERPEEIAGFVEAFLAHAVDPGLRAEEVGRPLIDVCGTGGDRLDLFNVSTTAMFVAAGAGAAVVKHGNRGITSKSGGADVLEALGVPIDLPPADFAESVRRHGVGFMLAPLYHPAFKAVAPVRKLLAEQGRRTIFNLIGPLLNPVRPDRQLIGAFDPSLPDAFVRILGHLGRTRAWSVCGDAGEGRHMDEFSTLGLNRVATLEEGDCGRLEVDPADLGIPAPPSIDALRGGDAAANAAVLEEILAGSIRDARRDLALLNAAAALVVAGIAADLPEGLARAAESVDSGRAAATLEAIRRR